jgi:predicted phage terminase large subunit-like protein
MSALTKFSRRFAEGGAENKDASRIEPPKESFADFIGRVAPHYRIYDFTQRMIDVLERVYKGEVCWLFINMPPRFGKPSLLELFAAWCMLNDPTLHIGYCSYNQMIASDPCKNAREYYLAGGGEMNPSQAAKINWETLHKGKMWASGFGGTVRGRGYHIGIIDDAHKDSEELFSDAKVRQWHSFWDKTWINRGMAHSKRPVCRIVIGQRLGDNDVFAYILAGEAPEKWTGIVFDLVKDTQTKFADIPESVTLIQDDREDGDLLEPAICTPTFMATVGVEGDPEREAQYQQRPKAISGQILQPTWFPILKPHQVATNVWRVVGADLAIKTGQNNDWTVFFPITTGHDGRIYVYKPYREKVEAPALKKQIPAWMTSRRVALACIESVAFQEYLSQDLRQEHALAGIPIVSPDILRIKLPGVGGKARTDKEANARQWAPLAEQGRIVLVEDDNDPWVATFLAEVKAFPRGKHDDQIDALGFAILALRYLLASGQGESAVSG